MQNLIFLYYDSVSLLQLSSYLNEYESKERKERKIFFVYNYCVEVFLLVALNSTTGVTSLIQNMILSHTEALLVTV